VRLLRHRRVRTTASSSSACDCSGITECAPQLRVTIRRVRLLRHRRVRTTASSSSACDCSGITECAPQLRVTIRGVRLLRHRRVRTAASTSSACDSSGITERAPQLRVTIRRVRLLRHRRVRTTASTSSACDSSGITERAPQLRVTIRRVRLLLYDRVRTTTPSIGIDSTKYREGSFVFLTKEFTDAGCRIDFVRGRTSHDGANRRLGRYVEYRGYAIGAPILVTAPGIGVSFPENFCFGNNLEGGLSGKEWSPVGLHEQENIVFDRRKY